MSTCAETSDTTDNINTAEVAVAVVIPLIMVGVVNTLIVVCIIACQKSQKLNNRINVMCGTAKRYFRPTPRRHSLSRQARSGIHSATELTLNIESQTNDDDGEMKQNGEDKETEQRMKRQSTISQQNEAYGVIEMKQNGEDKETEQRMKRQSTISQQNEAYGIIGGVKQPTVTQQNEAYGLNNTGTPVFSMKQPDTGQESDEYSYVRFQTKS